MELSLLMNRMIGAMPAVAVRHERQVCRGLYLLLINNHIPELFPYGARRSMQGNKWRPLVERAATLFSPGTGYQLIDISRDARLAQFDLIICRWEWIPLYSKSVTDLYIHKLSVYIWTLSAIFYRYTQWFWVSSSRAMKQVPLSTSSWLRLCLGIHTGLYSCFFFLCAGLV